MSAHLSQAAQNLLGHCLHLLPPGGWRPRAGWLAGGVAGGEEGLRERDQGAGFNTDLGAGKWLAVIAASHLIPHEAVSEAFERADGMGKSIGLTYWSAQCDVGNLELCGQFSS